MGGADRRTARCGTNGADEWPRTSAAPDAFGRHAPTAADDPPSRQRLPRTHRAAPHRQGSPRCRTTPVASSMRSHINTSAGTKLSEARQRPASQLRHRRGSKQCSREPARRAHFGVREPGHDLISHDTPAICPGVSPGRRVRANKPLCANSGCPPVRPRCAPGTGPPVPQAKCARICKTDAKPVRNPLRAAEVELQTRPRQSSARRTAFLGYRGAGCPRVRRRRRRVPRRRGTSSRARTGLAPACRQNHGHRAIAAYGGFA